MARRLLSVFNNAVKRPSKLCTSSMMYALLSAHGSARTAPPDDLPTNVLHAGAARGVQLVDVRVLTLSEHLAIVACRPGSAVGLLSHRSALARRRPWSYLPPVPRGP